MLFVNDCLNFESLHDPFLRPEKDDFLFCYNDNKIALTGNNKVPFVSELIQSLPAPELYCFGSIDNHKCFLWNQDTEFSLNFSEVKSSCLLLSKEFQHAVVLGNYIACWRKVNYYCGRCGMVMKDSVQERARVCSSCNNTVYPRISPCVIVLITNGEKILLARSPHFPPGIFSALAGFINLGETVEQAVIREVKEEVGIEINNLEYVCSQPWPFPDSLMLGFTAKYLSGDIYINKAEIEFAAWFDKNNLPKIPSEMSIARYLIDRYLKNGS